jgi:hypothetical protein
MEINSDPNVTNRIAVFLCQNSASRLLLRLVILQLLLLLLVVVVVVVVEVEVLVQSPLKFQPKIVAVIKIIIGFGASNLFINKFLCTCNISCI